MSGCAYAHAFHAGGADRMGVLFHGKSPNPPSASRWATWKTVVPVLVPVPVWLPSWGRQLGLEKVPHTESPWHARAYQMLSSSKNIVNMCNCTYDLT